MKSLLFLASLAIGSISYSYAEVFSALVESKSSWNAANHPGIIVKNYVSVLELLPLKGEALKLPWSDPSWARKFGGISYRWQTDTPARSYRILTPAEVGNLTTQEINELSGAEKFDLLHAEYDFPFTRKIKSQNPSNRPEWEGICHGWTVAAIHHPQGQPVTFTNDKKLEITFGSSDVGAILSYYYAKIHKGSVAFMGKRCRSGVRNSQAACEDVNAGAFHIVLSNMLGVKGQAFIADIHPGAEVFNVPVASFASEIVEERAGSHSGREVLVTTQVRYILEGPGKWEAVEVPNSIVKTYQYWLELNAQNEIIGGTWVSAEHPDFVWYTEKAKLGGVFAKFDFN